MDIFTEKEIVDCLKSIALSLKSIEQRLGSMEDAIRESGFVEEEFD